MKSILICLMLGVSLFMGCGKDAKTFDRIQDVFKESCCIEVIIDNSSKEYKKQSQEYNKILDEFQNMIDGSIQMPAFGVSLDNETKQAIKSGVWIKFCFDFVGYNSEMPFDTLLIQVDGEYRGFNIIRGNNNLYEGRCFYLDLNCNMQSLYNRLLQL